AARLAVEAFRSAADAQAFPPEQTGGFPPWQARKIYESATGVSTFFKGGVQVDTGKLDSLLGITWAEEGARARAQHRTQGMGALPAGPTLFSFSLVDSVPAV